MPISRREFLAILVAGGIGVIAAAVSYMFMEILYQARAFKIADGLLWPVYVGPGGIFGVAIGLYLLCIDRASFLKAVAFTVLSTGAWLVTYWYASGGFAILGFRAIGVWHVSVSAGAIGGILIVLSSLLLFPFYRQWNIALATVLISTATGLLVTVSPRGGSLLVFGTNHLARMEYEHLGWLLLLVLTVWQGAVAACFGWGVARAQRAAIAARNTGSPARRPG